MLQPLRDGYERLAAVAVVGRAAVVAVAGIGVAQVAGIA
jgi:hypothetical protein